MIGRFRVLCLLLIWCVAWSSPGLAETVQLRLGVFAFRPKPVMVQLYQPLVDHLNQSLPGVNISLIPLDQAEMESAIGENRLDLLFTNPSHFVLLRQRNNLTGAIATLVAMDKGVSSNRLGGVILARRDRHDVERLSDLRGKLIAVPGTKFLGGYQTQAFELLEAGVKLPDDARLKDVGGHDAVVRALLAGEADAGFVRTGIIEAMGREGSLPSGVLKVVNRQTPPAFPFAVSTRLYPEWAFAALPHVNERLIRQIARALLDIEPGSPVAKAANIYGFTVPGDYLPVENLARALRLPPFEDAPDFTIADVLTRYWPIILILMVAGSVILVLVLFLSLTNRRLNEQTQQLEAMNAEILEAKRHADLASQSKSEFLANMSHEIRTPMNAILGLAHLLGQTEQSAEQYDYTAKIASSGRSLLGILNDILDFSKIEAGRLDVEHIDFRLPTLFDDLATIMSVNAGRKDLETVISLDPSLPKWVRGDPSRLQQVLVNLVGNAVKFTEQGTVVVRAERVMAEGAGLRFSVRDTGIGMTLQQMGTLFRPFTQADASTTRRFGGTGLGLAICKRLVELMGGEIGVSSQPGQGSEFWFTLPLTVGTAPQEEQMAHDMAHRSVLLAADNPVTRTALVSIVESLGWTARMVESGPQLLDLVRRGASPDVVLLDWQMPGMDGLETCRHLRAEEWGHKGTVIVMVPGHQREMVGRAPGADGVDAVLMKPVTPSSLYNAALEIHARRSGRSGGKSVRGAKRQPRLTDLWILLVEDNEINQEVARKILEKEGALVDLAADGAQAVQWLRQHRQEKVDLVLMDVQMPVMSGYEATQRIREELQWTDLPVIALSAGVQQSERDECLAAGMNDFAAKPLNINQLVATILRHAPRRDPVREGGDD